MLRRGTDKITCLICLSIACFLNTVDGRADELREMQTEAYTSGRAAWGYWGVNPQKYSGWTNHSNRLTPIYTFGLSLEEVKGAASPYRDAAELRRIYGRVPEGTLNPDAEYFDQTDVYRLQKQAIASGKKYVVLMIFDGMDWPTTWAAAIHKRRKVSYREGRGSGLLFQDYRGTITDFGFFVTSPHNNGTSIDVDGQIVKNPGGTQLGGYDPQLGGATPWSKPSDLEYLLGKNRRRSHAYTDSASSAVSMTCGIKTYNGAMNVDTAGEQVEPIGRWLQRQERWSVGVVTNVPISHATVGCAYANNVHRSDYQDLSRDMLGLPSIAHRNGPLPGVDVLIGAGWGETKNSDAAQGRNFVPGNRYLTSSDLAAIDYRNGGPYEVAVRTSGVPGNEMLQAAAQRAVKGDRRLFGFFGVPTGHLPYQTADGRYDPTVDAKKLEKYSQADRVENPTLADMTRAALTVLESNENGFWLMLEAGDVDWANHANNIDNSIGSVLSGEAAFAEVIRWIEMNDRWDEAAVIVTADHGHLLTVVEPEKLAQ